MSFYSNLNPIYHSQIPTQQNEIIPKSNRKIAISKAIP